MMNTKHIVVSLSLLATVSSGVLSGAYASDSKYDPLNTEQKWGSSKTKMTNRRTVTGQAVRLGNLTEEPQQQEIAADQAKIAKVQQSLKDRKEQSTGDDNEFLLRFATGSDKSAGEVSLSSLQKMEAQRIANLERLCQRNQNKKFVSKRAKRNPTGWQQAIVDTTDEEREVRAKIMDEMVTDELLGDLNDPTSLASILAKQRQAAETENEAENEAKVVDPILEKRLAAQKKLKKEKKAAQANRFKSLLTKRTEPPKETPEETTTTTQKPAPAVEPVVTNPAPTPASTSNSGNLVEQLMKQYNIGKRTDIQPLSDAEMAVLHKKYGTQ